MDLSLSNWVIGRIHGHRAATDSEPAMQNAMAHTPSILQNISIKFLGGKQWKNVPYFHHISTIGLMEK